MKIEGLDAITKQLAELEKALGNLDGDLAKVSFDPDDPNSIENAIQDLNNAIDAKIGGYGRNEMVANIAEQLKENGRAAILERAARARAGEDDDDDAGADGQ